MSKKNGRPYRGPRSARDLASGKLGPSGFDNENGFVVGNGPRPSAHRTESTGSKPTQPSIGRAEPFGSGTPAAPKSPPPGPSPAGLGGGPSRLRGKRGILIAVGAAAAGGGGLVYDRKRRRAQVSKLYDPFTDTTVEFGKRQYQLEGGNNTKELVDNAERIQAIGRHNVGRGVAQGAGIGGAAGTAIGALSGGRGAAGAGALGGAYIGAIGGAVHGQHKTIKSAEEQGLISRAPKRDPKTGKVVQKRLIPADPASGTNVRSVRPILPGGRHVSHENDLYEHGRRKVTPHGDTAVRRYRGKGSKPAEGGQPIRKSLSTQQGAAAYGSRGTPMSGIAQAGRVGRRLTIA